jgi:predicted ATP-grasp superfamily ATP-dependent carboligase
MAGVMPENVLLIGASVRAAASSALRAGLSPCAVDLFADADLRAACPTTRLPGRYPDAFEEHIRAAPPGPWLYTGGLENHPRLIGRWRRLRPLWGNGEQELTAARNPGLVARFLRESGLPVPLTFGQVGALPPGRRWLLKPLRGAGGAGIRLFRPDDQGTPRPLAGAYLQELIDGEPAAALYVGDGERAVLLGLTRQLVGEGWLGAERFRYCGSVGPREPTPALRRQLQDLGDVLARRCPLRGVFGVDGVLRDDVFWPVEVNPRYTASVEVLEHATGLAALAWHRLACEGRLPPGLTVPPARGVVGKGVVFARTDLVVPPSGPWEQAVRGPPPPAELPPFADVPTAGQVIPARRPVVTVLVRADTEEGCLAALWAAAGEVTPALGENVS